MPTVAVYADGDTHGLYVGALVTSTAYTKSVTSNISHTAAIARVEGEIRALNTSISHTATVNRRLVLSRLLTSTVAHTAVLGRIEAQMRALSSTIAVTATLSRIKGFIRATSSTVAVTATIGRIESSNRAITSTISHTAAVARVLVLARLITSTINHTAGLNRVLGIIRALTSTIAVTATLTRIEGWKRTSTSTISHTVAIVRVENSIRAVVATIAHTAAVNRVLVMARTLNSSISHTTVLVGVRQFPRAVSSTIAHTAAVVRALVLGRTITSTINHTAALARVGAWKRAITSTISHTAAVARVQMLGRRIKVTPTTWNFVPWSSFDGTERGVSTGWFRNFTATTSSATITKVTDTDFPYDPTEVCEWTFSKAAGDWNLLEIAVPYAFVVGQTYTLTFRMKSISGNLNFGAAIADTTGLNAPLASTGFTLDGTAKLYSFTFTAANQGNQPTVYLNVNGAGLLTGVVRVTSVQVEDGTGATTSYMPTRGNQALNYDFETNITGINSYQGGVITRDNAHAKYGGWALKFVTPGVTSGAGGEGTSSSGIQGQADVAPGEWWMVYASMYSVAGGEVMFIANDFTNAASYIVSGFSPDTTLVAGWNLLIAKLQAPALATKMGWSFRTRASGAAQAVTVWVDMIVALPINPVNSSRIGHTAAIARIKSSIRPITSTIASTATVNRVGAFARAIASTISHTATLARLQNSIRALVSTVRITNLIFNGGFETNNTGWGGAGPNTIVRTTAKAHSGVASAIATYNNSGGDTNTGGFSVALSINSPYAPSIYTWIPSAYSGTSVNFKGEYSGASVSGGTANMALRDQWQRIIGTLTTAASGTGSVVLRLVGAANGDFVYVDDAQLEAGLVVHDYIATDGATASQGLSAGLTRVFGANRAITSTISYTATVTRIESSVRALSSTIATTVTILRALGSKRTVSSAVAHSSILSNSLSAFGRQLSSSVSHTATVARQVVLFRQMASIISVTVTVVVVALHVSRYAVRKIRHGVYSPIARIR